MKILWIVNIIFPYPALKINKSKNVTLGWLYGLYDTLIKNKKINLAIVATYDGKEFQKFEDDNGTIYYLLPCKNQLKYDKKLKKYWRKVVDDFKPDLAHIHGSEYAHALPFIEECPKIKTVTSIQGLCSVYAKMYYANIDFKNLLFGISFRDLIKFDNIFKQKKIFEKRGNNEINLLKKSDYLIGRTTWDYANAKAITGVDKYFFCNESLRDDFYNNQWNIANIEKNTIFVTQAYYPIKGFHFMIEALKILKNKYPNIKCYVSGYNIFENKSIKLTSYAKYIMKKIKQYNLSDNIKFLGLLDTKEMINYLKKANVFVQPSVIENSPNSLGEAMLLGMPCVSSNVGGVSDLLIHKKEGFTYPYSEPAMLAYYIEKIFEDDSLAIELGKNAHIHAVKTHNREINSESTIKIYKEICNKGGKINVERKN